MWSPCKIKSPHIMYLSLLRSRHEVLFFPAASYLALLCHYFYIFRKVKPSEKCWLLHVYAEKDLKSHKISLTKNGYMYTK